ncbi:hypothetical protein [Poritiphilus flavus]|uniref:Fimbrial assembly protein (PilN) n=1 Tax=Poritiphilus flavus TaxID=2697053 RepID=A0A6L9ECC2_9FLAO|nr:hypothetical protein [Poritiphilus flavus]NAS12385.1 hypothetical protein [Poritiphilus flavus]
MLKHIKQGKVFSGVEITENSSGISYELLVIKQAADELHIANRGSFNSLESLAEVVPKTAPLVIIINTSQVLTKLVGPSTNSNPEAIVNGAFPNLKLENFYYELIQKESDPLVSIVKRTYVDELMASFKQEGLIPYFIHFGLGSMAALLSYSSSDIAVSNYQLEILNHRIISIQAFSTAISEQEINGLALSHKEMLAFGGILGQIGSTAASSNFLAQNKVLRTEFGDQRIFRFSFRASLIFVLTLLLVNFLFFDHYHSQVSSLTETMEVNNSKISRLKELETDVSKKEERLALLQSSSNSRATFYLDQIAQTLPASVLLDQLIYQPLEKAVKESSPIQVDERVLLVKGISKDADHFSNWIVSLEALDWIASVQTMDYDYVSKTTSRFSLKITFHEK